MLGYIIYFEYGTYKSRICVMCGKGHVYTTKYSMKPKLQAPQI